MTQFQQVGQACRYRRMSASVGLTFLHGSHGEFRLLTQTIAICLSRCGGHSLASRPRKEIFKMGVIGWIVFGVIVGIVAKLLMPGRDPGGFIITTLLGIAGAMMGGFLGQVLGFYRAGEPAGYIMSILGAMLLLFLYRLMVGKTKVA
jgi:uncharacterized membrane protein YeaQ/YmgE (transglycosylase-associated protein family)